MSPRTNYQRGADKERRILNLFKKNGFISFRSAGSHSIIDVIAINKEIKIIKLIQSKLGYLNPKAKKDILEEGNKLDGTYEVKFELWAD